ncbi:MAG: UvrD-helicase domain-containing protein [Rhodobacterales bacterium]|nr:UvrD-helicase domain-containing protein [Rhodobacterales bacterium]
MSHVLIRAAAGCGKTTKLACQYLKFIADGVPVERAIAITFTRRAAAELIERVTLALRACLEGPEAVAAQRALGAAWPVYAAVAPKDDAVARQALADLPAAPIGTTDHFVHSFLTEFALYAAVPLPSGGSASLDVPIRASISLHEALERAARRILDPPEGHVDPDVSLLLRYFGLDEILSWMRQIESFDHLPAATSTQLFGLLSLRFGAALQDLHRHWPIDERSSAKAWAVLLTQNTRDRGHWAIPVVSAWFAEGGQVAQTPTCLPFWLEALDTGRPIGQQVKSALRREKVDLGAAVLSLADLIGTVRHPYNRPEYRLAADKVQEARERIRTRVVVQALTQAAAAGNLDHHALTEAAILLCRKAPAAVQGRFEALLVDEIQDANPVQLRLYEAIARLPGPRGIHTVYVGDARQSIYVFRGAEPTGFEGLVRDAEVSGAEIVDLQTNHRSHSSLVSAQRALFGSLTGPMRETGHQPLAGLTGLQSNAALDHLALDPTLHANPNPVWLVLPLGGEEVPYYAIDLRALRAFWERIQVAWTEPDHEKDTAVVLTSSWRSAHTCCQLLRTWAGSDRAAVVAGGGRWIEGPVGDDLRNLLGALLDPTQDVCWLGVWKHPAVGLSDGALARVRAGVGLAVPASEPLERFCRLGYLLDVDGLTAPHLEEDQDAFMAAREPLQAAREALGRRDTAQVLDTLATALDWRAVLRAGPDGEDGLAALEVALDLIRSLSAEGRSPEEILQALDTRENATELPRIHLEKPLQTITCTTVFQAKGLAWDHVFATSPGRAPHPPKHSEPQNAWLELDAQRMRLVGLKFDPTGALSAFKDPIGRLGAKIWQFRQEEECARTAYVALTRARRSVTMGLPTDLRNTHALQKLIATAWRDPSLEQHGVAFIEQGPLPKAQQRLSGWVSVATRPWPRVQLPEARSWKLRQPSSFASHLTVQQRTEHAERVKVDALAHDGLHWGGAPVHAPTQPALSAAVWGDIAHGWLAEWGFSGEPTATDAVDWLTTHWRCEDVTIAAWLVALSLNLRATGGPLWDLVSDPSAQLFFEHPLVGVAGENDSLLVSGRIDLFAVRGAQSVVIDFKAGANVPHNADDLILGASLHTYGPQLDAYRAALQRTGVQLDYVALWFVRTGSSVRW